MEKTAVPRTTRAVDLDEEIRIIHAGRIISGFKSSRECVNRLLSAGYSFGQIGGREVSIAIQREYHRQRMAGQRPGVRVTYDPPPIPVRGCDYTAVFDDYDAGDPIGRGATELEAVKDLMEQVEDRHV